jgi:hypothetical protein
MRSVVEVTARMASSRPRILAAANPIPVELPAPVTKSDASAALFLHGRTLRRARVDGGSATGREIGLSEA